MTRMPAAVEMDVAEGAEAEGARRATAAFGPSVTSRATDPDPEVPAKAQRRRFPAEYRLRILMQADACKKPGELGALLRREGLYSSLLTNWRRQREQGALQDMRGRRRGPKPRPVDPPRETARSREPSAAAEAAAGRDDHHAPKKSCRDPGDPPETPRHRRARLMIAIEAVTTTGATAALCQSVGLARATLYRRRQPARSSTPTPRAASSRALGPAERQAVLDVLHSERFVDQSPAEVQATLLEEQTYLCSTRTMYRILDAAEEVRERRAQARHPAYAKPELVATAPNQIWSWDITKLKGPIPYLYYSLYVILDLFSRYVVGWMVAAHENAHLAQRLIEATCRKQPHRAAATHDPRGPRRADAQQARRALVSPTSASRRATSRPRVSNDNPFSEAQFRTVKYRPDFPDRFGSIEHARAIGHDLFAWYNDAHHHSGLSYLTPADVHYGRAATILEVRHHTRLAAYAAHPERFVQGPPRGETLPTARVDQSAGESARRGCPRNDDRDPG